MSTDAYTLQVDNAPDADGWYVARIYRNGDYVELTCGDDRDKAIAEARERVEFRRTRDTSREVIEL